MWSHVTVINHMSHVVACHTHESHVTQADAESRDGELKTQETNHKPHTKNRMQAEEALAHLQQADRNIKHLLDEEQVS